jgi:tyrosine-protein kinase Etk/Wzc
MRQLVTAARRRLWLVATVFVTIVGITMWYTMQLPRLWRATTLVRIQEGQGPLGSSGPQVRDYRVNPLASEQQIIRSEAVAKRVVERLGLRLIHLNPDAASRSAIFGSHAPVVDSTVSDSANFSLEFDEKTYRAVVAGAEVGRAAYGSPLHVSGITVTVPAKPVMKGRVARFAVMKERDAVGVVRGSIRTRGLPETNIIEIAVIGTDPVDVQASANEITQSYANFSSDQKRLQSRSRTQFISQSLDEQQKRLIQAQGALKEFKEREQISNVQAEMSAMNASIASFQEARTNAAVEQRVYTTLMGKLSAADTATEDLRRLAGTDAVVKNEYIANLYNRWFQLSEKKEELIAQGKTENNEDVKSVNRLISNTKDDLRSASAMYLQNLRSRIASVDSTIMTLRRQTEKYPGLEATESRLLGDVRTMQGVYDQLQSEYQRARITEEADDNYVRVIDVAALPTSPVAPNRSRIFITSLVFGLLLGLAAAIFLDTLDDSVRSPDEVRERMGWPVLGTIPTIKGAPEVENVDSRLVAHFDPRSPVAEAYRSLRTNLAFARAHNSARVLVCTSPGPGDGKSTTVANLAITFAQQGQRTLLVDGDLRRAVLDRIFNVPRAPGLTNLLTGPGKLVDIAHETSIPNLFVLGSGPFPPNPSELLGSTAMRDLIREAGEAFDVVLIDSPPLLAVTDAAVISTMADGAIVVIRMGATTRAALKRTASQLEAVEGRLLGAVLNDVDFRQTGYGGQYGYYYYYYHHEAEGNGQGHGIVNRIKRWVRPSAKSGRGA